MQEVCYIGLDISTSIIGICLLDYKENLINLENINLKKIKCIFDKSLEVQKYFNELKSRYTISDKVEISIEEALQSFKRGLSSAKTLSKLTRFNGIVSYLAYTELSSKPLYISVNTARKNLQIKIDKSSDKTTKDQVFEWVRGKENFEWPEKVLKSGPNKGLVKYDECCYDMSDAYVICKAYLYDKTKINWREI